ncbi:serine hydrolase domain-containing protein [Fredinandcohnia humi]
MKKTLIVIGFFFAILLSGCTTEATKEPEQQKEAEKELKQLETYWPTTEWRTSTPEEQGMDSEKLVQVYEALGGEENLDSFLITRNGYIVAETYGNEYSSFMPHNIYSVSKSIMGAVVGIAVEEGVIGLDEKVLDYLPNMQLENLTEEKKNMTVRQFISMTSGIEWPEWEENRRVFEEWDASEDQVKFFLDKPVNKEQIGKFNYSSGESHVLSAILQQELGTRVGDYAEKKLFEPLGITNLRWSTDKRGISMGYAGIFMAPRDMAKFGLLYLNNGKWDGQQIVSEKWVQASTSPQSSTTVEGGEHYGYNFWLTEMHGHKVIEAMGAYGQYIGIVPDLQLVVVQTSAGGVNFDQFLKDYIIPAVVSDKPIEKNEEANKKLQELTSSKE